MSLENLYFKHEFNARNDPKIIKLKMKLGVEGIGIYWCLIEYLYEQNGFLSVEDIETFCFNERIEEEKVHQVIELAKFKYDKTRGYYSSGVLERIVKREEYSLAQKNKANKRWNKKQIVEDIELKHIVNEMNFNERKSKALKSLDEMYADVVKKM